MVTLAGFGIDDAWAASSGHLSNFWAKRSFLFTGALKFKIYQEEVR